MRSEPKKFSVEGTTASAPKNAIRPCIPPPMPPLPPCTEWSPSPISDRSTPWARAGATVAAVAGGGGAGSEAVAKSPRYMDAYMDVDMPINACGNKNT